MADSTGGMKERDPRIIEARVDYFPVLHEDGSFEQAALLSVLAYGLAGDRDLAAYQAMFTDEGAIGRFTKEYMTLRSGQKMRCTDAMRLFPAHQQLINVKWRR